MGFLEPTLPQEGVGPIKAMWSLCLGGGVWLGGGALLEPCSDVGGRGTQEHKA